MIRYDVLLCLTWSQLENHPTWTIQKSKSNIILAKRKKFSVCLILRRPTFPVIPGFSKEDRRSQASKPIFSNSTKPLRAKAFLFPVTTTVMRLNWQGHLSGFSRNKRALLLTPAGGSPHWICSDTSGNGPFLSAGGKVENRRRDPLIQAEFAIWFTYQERQRKLLFTSSPKMRPEHLRVVPATQRGETQGNHVSRKPHCQTSQSTRLTHSQMWGPQIGTGSFAPRPE